jgi:hypothetical protein
LDLNNEAFLSKHNGKWFEFTLVDEDKSNFYDPSILAVKDDTIIDHIHEWWESSDIQKKITEHQVTEYIKQKIEALNHSNS